MESLKERILSESQHLGRNVIKVDSFLNHQVDPRLFREIGAELAQRLAPTQPNKVLTVEVGGILPGFAVAEALGVPLVYARKSRAVGMPSQLLQESSLSPREERVVQLVVSPEFLRPEHRVVIVDDFLTSGQILLALARLCRTGGAQVVGVGVVIEKAFDHGREALAGLHVPVEALLTVERIQDGQIVWKE